MKFGLSNPEVSHSNPVHVGELPLLIGFMTRLLGKSISDALWILTSHSHPRIWILGGHIHTWQRPHCDLTGKGQLADKSLYELLQSSTPLIDLTFAAVRGGQPESHEHTLRTGNPNYDRPIALFLTSVPSLRWESVRSTSGPGIVTSWGHRCSPEVRIDLMEPSKQGDLHQ